jgi:hypothetical protein
MSVCDTRIYSPRSFSAEYTPRPHRGTPERALFRIIRYRSRFLGAGHPQKEIPARIMGGRSGHERRTTWMQSGVSQLDPVKFLAAYPDGRDGGAFCFVNTISPPAGIWTVLNVIPGPEAPLALIGPEHDNLTPGKGGHDRREGGRFSMCM